MRKIAYIASARVAGAAFLATLALFTNSTNGASTKDIFWSNNTAPFSWDTSSSNWLEPNGSSGSYKSAKFSQGDNVTFQNTIPGTNTPFSTPLTINIQNSLPQAGSINFTNSSVSYSFSGSQLSGTSLNKSGTGTVTLSSATSISGATTISAGTLSVGAGFTSTGGIQVNNNGTLMLGASNVIGNTTTVKLNGGVLNIAGRSESEGTGAGIGALTLSASSFIDFGTTVSGQSNTTLWFVSGSRTSTGGTLTINNWTAGTDQLRFTNSTGLDSTFLSNISFSGYAPGAQLVSHGSYYEVTPVPEPSTVLAGIGLVGMIGYRERRRIKSLITREPLAVG